MVEGLDLAPVLDDVEERAVLVAAGEGGVCAVGGVDEFDGAGVFIAEGVLDDVGGVGVVPCDGCGAEFFVEAPGDHAGDGVDVVGGVVWVCGGRADPDVPVEAFGSGFAGEVEVERDGG